MAGSGSAHLRDGAQARAANLADGVTATGLSTELALGASAGAPTVQEER